MTLFIKIPQSKLEVIKDHFNLDRGIFENDSNNYKLNKVIKVKRITNFHLYMPHILISCENLSKSVLFEKNVLKYIQEYLD